MTTLLTGLVKGMETKRLAALVLAPGFAALGLDAAIAHLAGRDLAHPAQLLPIVCGPLGALALAAVAATRRGPRALERGLRWVGLAMTALGAIGTGFHARALLRLLAGDALSWDGLMTALAVAPPLMAPGAFAGLGLAVFVLATPRLELRLRPEVGPAPVRPVPLAGPTKKAA